MADLFLALSGAKKHITESVTPTLPPAKCAELEAKCQHSFDPLRRKLCAISLEALDLHIHVP